LEVDGRADIIIDLSKPGALEDLNKHPFTIKEGATFRMKARFKVQHQILSGMKYVQVVSRMGVKNKMQEMIVGPLFTYGNLRVLTWASKGSYSPNTSDKPEYEKKCTVRLIHHRKFSNTAQSSPKQPLQA
jgi:Rho GDP-dissociation inhibitor